jgi:hypothetical protein
LLALLAATSTVPAALPDERRHRVPVGHDVMAGGVGEVSDSLAQTALALQTPSRVCDMVVRKHACACMLGPDPCWHCGLQVAAPLTVEQMPTVLPLVVHGRSMVHAG